MTKALSSTNGTAGNSSRSRSTSVSSSSSKTGDTVVFALAIALGVAMIVVIVLICVYANKRSGSDDDDANDGCRGSKDTKYIEIDVLAQETPVTVLAESSGVKAKAVVLAGPLHKSKSPTHVNASDVGRLVADSMQKYVFVYSDHCGACKKLQKDLGDLEAAGEDVSAAYLLKTEELGKLSADLKALLESQYIPTLFKVGGGTAVKELVGVPLLEKLRAYVVVKK